MVLFVSSGPYDAHTWNDLTISRQNTVYVYIFDVLLVYPVSVCSHKASDIFSVTSMLCYFMLIYESDLLLQCRACLSGGYHCIHTKEEVIQLKAQCGTS
jgi:amino acid permease